MIRQADDFDAKLQALQASTDPKIRHWLNGSFPDPLAAKVRALQQSADPRIRRWLSGTEFPDPMADLARQKQRAKQKVQDEVAKIRAELAKFKVVPKAIPPNSDYGRDGVRRQIGFVHFSD